LCTPFSGDIPYKYGRASYWIYLHKLGWWRGTAVERRSLAGELPLLHAQPSADVLPLMWVNRPLQISQLGQLSLLFAPGQ